MDTLPWPVIGSGSGWAIVAFCVYLILTGRLVPRRTYDEKAHEANEWRAESRIKDAQIAEKDRQLRHMREVGKLMKAVLAAVQRLTGIRVDDGGA